MTLFKKKKDRERAQEWARQIVLIIICLVWLFPVFYLLMTSFRSDESVWEDGYKFFPDPWTFSSYWNVLTNTEELPVMHWFLNSMIVSCTETVLVVIIDAMAAYAYSKMVWKGSKYLFGFLLFTMMIPSVVGLVPSYYIISKMGLKNNLLALILPGLGGVGNVFLIRQFMMGVPTEMLEAAKVDGAGEFRTFVQIMLPTVVPVLVVVAIFTFLGSWNDLLWPLIVMTDKDMYTLTSGLGQIGDSLGGNEQASTAAAAIISMIPVTLIYLFGQKFIIQGISLNSSVKG